MFQNTSVWDWKGLRMELCSYHKVFSMPWFSWFTVILSSQWLCSCEIVLVSTTGSLVDYDGNGRCFDDAEYHTHLILICEWNSSQTFLGAIQIKHHTSICECPLIKYEYATASNMHFSIKYLLQIAPTEIIYVADNEIKLLILHAHSWQYALINWNPGQECHLLHVLY